MKLLDFTIVKLTLCLIIGICLAYFVEIPLYWSTYSSGLLLLVSSVLFFISRNYSGKSIWFGLLVFLTTISIGVLTVNFHYQKNFKNHYSHNIISNPIKPKIIVFQICEILKSSNYYDKYVVDLLKINHTYESGKLLLNVKKDSTAQNLKVDERFQLKTSFEDINPPLNPNQFDYKNYLEKQYIFHQIFTDKQSLFKISSKTNTIFGFASRLREIINLKLKKFNFKKDELAIINALLLGQRQDIDQEIYDNYAKAGAIHILAVSGLHVGIILLFLTFIFKPIEQFKHGIIIKTSLILIILWCFAIIAGLSASVTRAVTMFSIIAIGLQFKRPTNIYNTLAISMFLLLLIKPMFLFDVGFQLSYAAVFAIVSIYPLLYTLWKPKYILIDKFWQVFVVTISAQFGVVPLSLFYFHQFPGLFFLSNLVIVPLLGFILGFGIIIILLALLNILPNVLATTYENIINLMNIFVEWISHQEEFLFKDIPFGILYVFAFYLLIISLVRLFKMKNFSSIIFLLIAIVFCQSTLIYNKIVSNSNQFIIFHKSRYTLIGNKVNANLYLDDNLDSLARIKDHIIRNYKIGNYIKVIHEDTLKNIYSINDEKLLVLDSIGIYNVKSFKPDYILLRHSPKVNLNRLIDSIHPKLIVADGSNYKSYIERWEKTCEKRKLPFHITRKKGAFVIENASFSK